MHPADGDTDSGAKKIGFFDSERDNFTCVAQKIRMIPRQSAAYSWSRHPLALLVEAADDICYAIVDIEDGYDLGYLCFEEAEQILKPIAGERSVTPTMKARDKVAKWRAIAIGNLINAAVEAFKTNQNDILDGTFRDDLIAHTEYKSQMAEATSLARKRIYWSERKTRIEIAASEIIFGLLDFFVPIAIELEQSGWDSEGLSGRYQKCARPIVPDGFEGVKSRYEALLRVTDFVSGMTDRYALDLHRKLKGISVNSR